MKEFCNKIMRLDTLLGAKKDYSQIVFLIWMLESNFLNIKNASIYSFCQYVFRFYIDNTLLSKEMNFPLIKNIHNFSPSDLNTYCIEVLRLVEEKTSLISISDKNIYLTFTETITENDLSIIKNVVRMMIKKYIPIKNFEYSSVLSNDEYDINNTRLFNRVLELINYCFICDNTNIEELQLIRLKNNSSKDELLDVNNYFLLCKEHARLFNDGSLIIKKNGYPYLNDSRLYSHIEIEVLKKVRKYLV